MLVSDLHDQSQVGKYYKPYIIRLIIVAFISPEKGL